MPWGFWQSIDELKPDTAVLVMGYGFNVAHWNSRAGQWLGNDWGTRDTKALNTSPPQEFMELPPPPKPGEEVWPWKLINSAPRVHILLVFSHSYNIAHYDTQRGGWRSGILDATTTRSLQQFPPTHWADLLLPSESGKFGGIGTKAGTG